LGLRHIKIGTRIQSPIIQKNVWGLDPRPPPEFDDAVSISIPNVESNPPSIVTFFL
jgi:hypothetical protein